MEVDDIFSLNLGSSSKEVEFTDNWQKHGDFCSVGDPQPLLPKLSKDTPALLAKLDLSDRVISLIDWQLRLLMRGNRVIELDIHNCPSLTKVTLETIIELRRNHVYLRVGNSLNIFKNCMTF